MQHFHPISKLKKELLADPEVKKYYDALAPEYELIEAFIDKRLEQQLSQKELAKKVGTGQSAISRLESGTHNPSLKFLQRVATALNARLSVSLE